MTDDLVKRLREDVEEFDGTCGKLATLAADRIEELRAMVDLLNVAARDLCCHVPSAELVNGISDQTKAVLETIVWKEDKK